MTLSIAEQAKRYLLNNLGSWCRTRDIATGIGYYPGFRGYNLEHYLRQIVGVKQRSCECGLTLLWMLCREGGE